MYFGWLVPRRKHHIGGDFGTTDPAPLSPAHAERSAPDEFRALLPQLPQQVPGDLLNLWVSRCQPVSPVGRP
jgi:hypothetical protein